MASTTPGPQLEVLNEIQSLFNWNPPHLIPTSPLAYCKKSSTASTTIRPSAFYDKHFSSDLVLERIEHLPSLVWDLARNVDTLLQATLKTLPPLDGFLTAQQREVDIDNLTEIVTNEIDVARFYQITTARFCLPLASTLALHPIAEHSKWRTLLTWIQSARHEIVGGLLRFIGEGVNEKTKALRAAIVEGMESENRRIFEEKRKSMSPLATWIMKSPCACPREVMTAVLALGKFSWTTCTTPDCLLNPKERKNLRVARITVGPDAQVPPWSFPVSSFSLNRETVQSSLDLKNCDEEIDILPPLMEPTPQRSITQQITRSGATSDSSMLPPSGSSVSENVSPTKDKGSKKRTRDQSGLERVSPTIDKGKKPKQDDEEEVYQGRHDLTAKGLVQQAWAQAVQVDGTVIIIHSGNYELVCVRHRASQTLYVSDLIEPPTCANPGYGKLQVSIYIAAIQDAIDRFRQLPTTTQPKSPGGGQFIGGDKDRYNREHNRGSGSGRKDGRGNREGKREGGYGVGKSGSTGRFQGLAGKNDPNVDELVAVEKTIHMANSRDVVLLYLRYDVYDSPVPTSFLRSAPSILANTGCPTPPFSSRAMRTHRLEECLTIVLTSEIGTVPLDVVVKLAFYNEQRDALRSEYEVYRRLRSKGVLRGIATVLGFFDDSEDTACALVMLYAGIPIVMEPQRTLSVSDRKSALSTLESIHRASILHGDIRRENILVGDLGVTIIDFGHSKQCNDQEAKDKEFARLCYLLDLACESH